ncbi:hypothetical protein F4703DRAFT_1980920 [Phycomyces blakesleeanus]
MPPKRTSKNAENSNKKLQIKQYKLSGFEEEKKLKKAHGSWNDTKELVLLQEYAHLFPPSLKKGAHKKAWQDIVKSVNDVTPGETELSYDTCHCKILKLVDIYKNAFEERTVADTLDANRNRPEKEQHEAFKVSDRNKEIAREDFKLGLEGCVWAIALGAPGQITNLRQKYQDFIKKTNAEMQEKFPAESSAMAAARPVGSQASPASIEDEKGKEGKENENANEEDEVEDEDHPEVGNEVPESQVTRHAEVMEVLKQIL